MAVNKQTFKTGPAFTPGRLWQALTTTYGISDDLVYSKRSLFGIPFGNRPSVPVERVTRTHSSGALIGNVTFGEGSHDPVVWEFVCRPEAKLKRAREVLEACMHASTELSAPPWYEGLELADHVVLVPSMPQGLLYGLRRTFGTPYGAAIRDFNTGEWVKQGEPIVVFRAGLGRKLAGPSLLAPADGQVVDRGVYDFTHSQFFATGSIEHLYVAAFRPTVNSVVSRQLVHVEIEQWLPSVMSEGSMRPEDDQATRHNVIEATKQWMSMPLKRTSLEIFRAIKDGDSDIKWNDLEDC